MEGWIKIHRSICNHWIFKDAEKYRSWITILIEVNHTDNKVNLGGKLFECKRGDSLNSLDTWAKLFGKKWDKSKVRRFFKLLEKDSMIVLKNESKTTRLTVCNYESYQGERNEDETQVKHKRNASETHSTLNKNEKNEKNEKNIKQSQLKFYEELKKYLGKYSKEMIRSFYDYWSEPNKSNTKIKYQMEKTWDIERRLSRWNKNDFNKSDEKLKTVVRINKPVR